MSDIITDKQVEKSLSDARLAAANKWDTSGTIRLYESLQHDREMLDELLAACEEGGRCQVCDSPIKDVPAHFDDCAVKKAKALRETERGEG